MSIYFTYIFLWSTDDAFYNSRGSYTLITPLYLYISVGHPLEIEPMQVLTALGEFIKIFEPPEKKKLFNIL